MRYNNHMTIKITVQDAVSDLFDVVFKDDYAMYLSKFIVNFPVMDAAGNVTGSKYVMKHTDLSVVMEQMAM
jgi:hypothetical protein